MKYFIFCFVFLFNSFVYASKTIYELKPLEMEFLRGGAYGVKDHPKQRGAFLRYLLPDKDQQSYVFKMDRDLYITPVLANHYEEKQNQFVISTLRKKFTKLDKILISKEGKFHKLYGDITKPAAKVWSYFFTYGLDSSLVHIKEKKKVSGELIALGKNASKRISLDLAKKIKIENTLGKFRNCESFKHLSNKHYKKEQVLQFGKDKYLIVLSELLLKSKNKFSSLAHNGGYHWGNIAKNIKPTHYKRIFHVYYADASQGLCNNYYFATKATSEEMDIYHFAYNDPVYSSFDTTPYGVVSVKGKRDKCFILSEVLGDSYSGFALFPCNQQKSPKKIKVLATAFVPT